MKFRELFTEDLIDASTQKRQLTALSKKVIDKLGAAKKGSGIVQVWVEDTGVIKFTYMLASETEPTVDTATKIADIFNKGRKITNVRIDTTDNSGWKKNGVGISGNKNSDKLYHLAVTFLADIK